MNLTEADSISLIVYRIIIHKMKILKEEMDTNFQKKQGN